MVTSNEEKGFEALGLKPELVAALAELGYEEPTPIQREAIPLLLAGKDLIGQAATGTGKTAAFALPLLQRFLPGESGPFQTTALILVPTRELAMQVAEAVFRYGKRLGVRVLAVYGGQEMGQQLRRLKGGVDVVVATPGRALDHLRRKSLKLDTVKTVVLDEADEMLDMGFAEDLDTILSAVPAKRQTALFSATLPPRIAAIAEKHLKSPARLKLTAERPAAGTLPRVRQTAYVTPKQFKLITLARVLDLEAPTQALVFCRTRNEVDLLAENLQGHGLRTESLHGGMSQDQRDRVMKRFKAREAELLVATDVAARGLDINHLSHVVNYDLPTSPEVYVHRIGRTGRAKREGVAITLVEPREARLLSTIERATRQPIQIAKVPTVGDVETHRLTLTRAVLRELLASGELEAYRPLVEELAREFPVETLAAAAIKGLHEARHDGTLDPTEVPATASAPKRTEPVRDVRGGQRPERSSAKQRLFIGLGKRAGLRPADLVGAIVNEAKLPPKSVGAIQIEDAHAFVEVTARDAERVLEALRRTKIRGRKVFARRQRD
ncbi:MAG: DEAD/DEAH box helicase [Myxococcaceae bacterium]